jgi:hypothetical protein
MRYKHAPPEFYRRPPKPTKPKKKKKKGRPRGSGRKKCDGTANDYRRHMQHGEPPCQTSRVAWRAARRRERRLGVWIGNLVGVEEVDHLKEP